MVIYIAKDDLHGGEKFYLAKPTDIQLMKDFALDYDKEYIWIRKVYTQD